MDNIWLKWFQSKKLRWFGVLIAVGLAGWIILSESSTFAQQTPSTQPDFVEYRVAAQPESQPPADVDRSKSSAAAKSQPTALDSPIKAIQPLAAAPSEIQSPTTVDSAKSSEADLLKPPIGKAPIKVSVGLFVSNLADINQAAESFDLAGYLIYSWHDSRLAYKPQPNETSRVSSLDKIWHPTMEMVNFKASTSSDHFVDILPDGTVQVEERFVKTLSSELLLQKFPFDRQSLHVILESRKYDNRLVELVIDAPKMGIGKDSFVSMSEWQVGTVTATKDDSFFPPENQKYSRVTALINLKRNYGFYLLKVMIPLLLITIASWSVFWIDPDQFSTQITIAFTNLLTVVALLLVINDKLPRVGYLTLIDGFTMSCFVGILGTIFILIAVHSSSRSKDPRRPQKIQNLAKGILPISFIIANIIMFIDLVIV